MPLNNPDIQWDAPDTSSIEWDTAPESLVKTYGKAALEGAKKGLGLIEGPLSALGNMTVGQIPAAVAGLGGLARLRTTGSLSEANKTIQGVQETLSPWLTHEPQTVTGEYINKVIISPFTELGRGAEAAGNYVADQGYPNLAAGVSTGIQALPFLLPVAGKAAKMMKDKKAIPIPKGVDIAWDAEIPTGRQGALNTIQEKGRGEETLAPQAGEAKLTEQPPLVDRRQDVATRKTISEMTPEEMRTELLVSQKTGLPNRRAYDESARMGYHAFVDADSLKWINDNMEYKNGEVLLRNIGEALDNEVKSDIIGSKAYHVHGDEFIVEGRDAAHVNEIMQRVQARLDNAELIYTTPDGTVYRKKGLEVTHGTGKSLDEAERALKKRKVEREATGERAGRGEQPPGVAIEAPSGRETGSAAPAEIKESTDIPSERTLYPGLPLDKTVGIPPQKFKGLPDPQGNIAAGSLAADMPLPKYAGNINLERIDAGTPVKKIILDTADRYKGAIDEARRGEITLEETKKLADDLGLTPGKLMQRRKGQAFNAEEATAARDILNASASALKDMQKAAATIGSDEALAQFRVALSRHAAVQAQVAGIAAEAGRALSAHRIFSTPTKNYKAMLDALGGREVTEKIIDRMKGIDVDNVQEVNAFVKAFAKVKRSDMVFEAWINFLLSGPKTHIVNIVSNTLTALTKPFETVIGATLEAVAKGPNRERFYGEAPAEVIGGIAGIKDGVRGALKAWHEELSSDTLIKVENAGKYQSIPGRTGKFIRGPGRALAAADEFFKSVNYSAELYSLAYREAALEGLKGQKRVERTAEILQTPTDKMVELARHEAVYRTFTQPYGKWSKILEKTRQIPGVKYLIPFMRTPVNIAKFSLERTPLNFARIAHLIKKGELKGADISDELAKPILGSMIAFAVYQMGQEGLIAGGGPKDKPERDMLYRTGWQPYSFKIGDTYVPYGRLEPIGSVVGMSADFSELAADKNDKEISDMTEAIALSFSKNLTSKTFVKGLSVAIDAMSDPKRYGEQFMNNFAGSLVPSIVNTGAQATDPLLRQTEGPLDAMQVRIPYLSQDLAPKRDLWGRPIERQGNAIERTLSPFPFSKETIDNVDKEMRRLDISIGVPKNTITIGKKTVKLSPIEYDLYSKRAGERAHEKVEKIITLGINDEAKRNLIKKTIKHVRKIERDRIIRIKKGQISQ